MITKILLTVFGISLILLVPHILVFAGRMRTMCILAAFSMREVTAKRYGYIYVGSMTLASIFAISGFIVLADQLVSLF